METYRGRKVIRTKSDSVKFLVPGTENYIYLNHPSNTDSIQDAGWDKLSDEEFARNSGDLYIIEYKNKFYQILIRI